MKIKKHGTKANKEYGKEKFVCEYCGCEFVVNSDEYYIDTNSYGSTASITSTHVNYESKSIDTYICSCPECHRILKKKYIVEGSGRYEYNDKPTVINQCDSDITSDRDFDFVASSYMGE